MPVQDNQGNPADAGADFWTYAFRDVIQSYSDADLRSMTYSALFTKMKESYFSYGWYWNDRTRPTDKSKFPGDQWDPTCTDPNMLYDSGYINPTSQIFLTPFSS